VQVAKWQNCQRAKLECKRQRPDGNQLGRPLTKIIECRLDTLDHQRRYCQAPATPRFQRQVITGSLLPAGDTLDRLLRYETHADRSLTRALDTLARLRGVTVETLSATVTRAVMGSPSASPRSASSANSQGPITEHTTTQIAASRVAVCPVPAKR
jgi:hypothetical protein